MTLRSPAVSVDGRPRPEVPGGLGRGSIEREGETQGKPRLGATPAPLRSAAVRVVPSITGER